MTLRERIKAFLRDDDLHTKLDVVLTHVDRVSVQVAALEGKKFTEEKKAAQRLGAKPGLTWGAVKREMESGEANG